MKMGILLTVVMNQSDLEMNKHFGTSSAVEVVIPAHAIQTLVY